MAKRKNPYGLPTKPFGNIFGGYTSGQGATAPDFFAPLANSSRLQGMRPGAGGNRGGGGNPYGGILNEFLNSSKARFAADAAADAASRDAAIQRMIISYGQVPDFAKLGIGEQTRGFLQGALSDKVRQLAEANTKEGTSVYARQARANEVANRRIPAQLAARGMLRSGQTGSDLQDQAQAYKIQGFDTLNEMLGGIEGTVSNFLNAERARADALAQAELQAQMGAYGEYGGDMYSDPFSGGGRSSVFNRALLGGRAPGGGRFVLNRGNARVPRRYPNARNISLRGVRPGGRR